MKGKAGVITVHICLAASKYWLSRSVVPRVTALGFRLLRSLSLTTTATPTRGPLDRVISYLLVLLATRINPHGTEVPIQWGKPQPERTCDRGRRLVCFRRYHAPFCRWRVRGGRRRGGRRGRQRSRPCSISTRATWRRRARVAPIARSRHTRSLRRARRWLEELRVPEVACNS